MLTVLGALVWVSTGILTYGLQVHYFQTKYSLIAKEAFVSDRIFAAFAALLGPIGLVAFLLTRATSIRENPPLGWKL